MFKTPAGILERSFERANLKTAPGHKKHAKLPSIQRLILYKASKL